MYAFIFIIIGGDNRLTAIYNMKYLHIVYLINTRLKISKLQVKLNRTILSMTEFLEIGYIVRHNCRKAIK